jgi:hypothetical protein
MEEGTLNNAPPPSPDGSTAITNNTGTAPPPPPDGSAVVPVSAPPTAPPPPPDGSAVMPVSAPQVPPTNTPTTPKDQPGMWDRVVDNSVANSVAPVINTPIDSIGNMMDSIAAGHPKEALKHAYDVYSKLMPSDPDNPIVKLAYNTIIGLGQQVHETAKNAIDTFNADRKAGHGVVASAADVATGTSAAKQQAQDLTQRVSTDRAAGNTEGVVGDILSHVARQNPVIGSVLGNSVSNADEDLHQHNHRALIGDAISAALSVLPMLASDGAADTTDVAGGSNRFTRAAETVRKAQRTAAQAPGDFQAEKALSRAVADAHQAARDQVNATFAKAHGEINANHEAVTASHQQALNEVDKTFTAAHRQISASHMGTTAEHQAALAQSEFLGHQAEQGAQVLAQSAPEDSTVTENVRDATNAANKQMHLDYVASGDKLQELTKDATIPFDGSNTHQAALELLGQGSDEGPLTQAVSRSLPGGPQANQILNNLSDTAVSDATAKPLVGADGAPLSPEQQADALAAHGMDADTEDGTLLDKKPAATVGMPDLIKAYQKLGENSRKVGFATSSDIADQDIYNRLKKGIIDDIAQLANSSGNPEAIQIAEKMNSDYRNNVRLYQNPAVKALREGRLSDVDARLTGRQASPGDIAAFKQILGDAGFKDFANGSLRRLFADAVNADGTPNWGKALTKLGSMDSEVRHDLYGELGSSALDTLRTIRKSTQDTKAAQEALTEVDQTKQDALKGLGTTTTGKTDAINDAQKAADKSRDTALEGIGNTAAGQTKEIDDSIAHMLGDGNLSNLISDPERLERFTKAVGPKGVKEFANMWIDNQIRNASLVRKGADFVPARFDPDKFLDSYIQAFKKNPDGVTALFKPDARAEVRFDRFMKNMDNASSVKSLVKNGVIRTSLGAAGSAVGSFYGPFEAAMMGLLAGGTTDIAFGRAKSFVDALANHPGMWKFVDQVGKVGGSPIKTMTGAAKAVSGPAYKALNSVAPAAARRAAMGAAYVGAKDSLGGNDNPKR